jgi:hypothetical protein
MRVRHHDCTASTGETPADEQASAIRTAVADMNTSAPLGTDTDTHKGL